MAQGAVSTPGRRGDAQDRSPGTLRRPARVPDRARPSPGVRAVATRRATFAPVITDVAADLELASLTGSARPIREWTTTFHLAIVALDPFTIESSWVLGSAERILSRYREADVRCAFLVTGTPDEARTFLGPLGREFLAFSDPDRVAAKGLGLTTLPAFVHINQHHQVEAAAEGWDPDAWREVAVNLSDRMDWTVPIIPDNGDPSPFSGTPV